MPNSILSPCQLSTRFLIGKEPSPGNKFIFNHTIRLTDNGKSLVINQLTPASANENGPSNEKCSLDLTKQAYKVVIEEVGGEFFLELQNPQSRIGLNAKWPTIINGNKVKPNVRLRYDFNGGFQGVNIIGIEDIRIGKDRVSIVANGSVGINLQHTIDTANGPHVVFQSLR